MTIQHIFYIPTIFLLGLVFGTMINQRKHDISTADSTIDSRLSYKTSGGKLIQTLLIFLLVFIATHMFEIPWGPKTISQLTGGLEIFDKKPAFSGIEVYNRLHLFPPEGLIAYKRFTYTVDILFPLSFFTFLYTFARFVSQRINFTKSLKTVLIALPFLWLASDLIENTVVFSILSIFPRENGLLSGALGYITVVKFTLLFLSIVTPSLLFLFRRKSQT